MTRRTSTTKPHSTERGIGLIRDHEKIPMAIEMTRGPDASMTAYVSGFDEETDSIIRTEISKRYGSIGENRRHVQRLFVSPDPSAAAVFAIDTRSIPSQSFSKAVVYACVLISDMCRGVLFPTLWLLIFSLGGSKSLQGVVVAAFSTGRIIASPIFGYLSEKSGFQKVLIGCNAIIIIGSLFYAAATDIWVVVLAQLILGLGAGSLGATRGYIAEQATIENRTSEMAYLTAVQYAGFTITPIIGAVISASFSGESRFTMPAVFIGGGAAVCILLLLTVFHDIERFNIGDLSSPKCSDSEDYGEPQKYEEFDVFEGESRSSVDSETNSAVHFFGEEWRLTVAGCLLNFIAKGAIAIFETLVVMFVSTHFHWDSIRLGIIISVCGIIGVIILLFFPIILRYVHEVHLIVGGFFMMTLSCLSCAKSLFPIVSEHMIYASLFLMFSIGYPIGHTALIGVFSKLCRNGPQGKLLGIFGSCGSLARIIFPICSAIGVQYFGFDWAFGVTALLLFTSSVVTIYFKHTIMKKICNQ